VQVGRPPGRAELGAAVGRPAVLPNDGVAQRSPGLLVPDHHGFPLVSDPEGLDMTDVRPCERLARDVDGDPQYLIGTVFDPTGARVDLPDLAVCLGENPALVIENERGRSGGALIDRENVESTTQQRGLPFSLTRLGEFGSPLFESSGFFRCL